MTIRRLRRAAVTVTPVHSQAAPELPQIKVKRRLKLIAQSPVDEQLVSEVFKVVPRLRRRPRKDGYTHVSDLIGKNKCVRKIALSDKFGTPIRPTRLSLFDRIVYAVGDTIHDVMKLVATEGAPHRVWGKWKCKCGHLFHDDPCLQSEIDPEDICPLCNTACTYYQEASVFNEEYNIVGNPDLLFWIEEVAAFHVIELKSIAEAQFKELARPLPEHVLQVVFYWWLMMESGRKVTDRVSIVYITKGYQFKGDPHKEFMIDPQAELYRLEPYLEDAMRLKLSRTQEVYPARKACSGEYTTAAKKCEVCQHCFSLPG